MNKASLCWLAALFYSCEAFSQTNSPPAPSLFLLPHLELKKLDCEPGQAQTARRAEASEHTLGRELFLAPAVAVTVATNNVSPQTSDVALNSSVNDDFFQKLDIYRRLDEGGYLTKPDTYSGNLLDRSIDSIFRPEPVRLGKTTTSCTLLTAIKRKNPLCLLNPIFFQLSW